MQPNHLPPQRPAYSRYDNRLISFALAKARYAPDAPWSAESLGLYTQATIQGAFILAKAKHGPEVAVECLGHLRRYLEMLFIQPKSY
jgi:hypothetical protein